MLWDCLLSLVKRFIVSVIYGISYVEASCFEYVLKF